MTAARDRTTAVAVVPARWAASRFPGKLLADLHGRSVLAHVHERLLRVRGLDRILIATDDARIEEEARRIGAEVCRTSPAHASGTDRIGEAVEGLRPAPDFVVNVQGDEPVFAPEAIERMCEAMHARPDAIWTLAERSEDPEEWARPSVVKVVCAADGRALYFSRAAVPYFRDAAQGTARLRHVGVYGYPLELLRAFLAAGPSPLERMEGLEQLRALERGIPIRVVVGAWQDPGIDTPEDLERLLRRYPTAEALAQAGQPKERA